MEHFVKEYLNKQGIKTVEGLAQHIIELKRNTVVPKIVFELVDVLVNDKDCLLSFFGENNKVDTVSNRDFVGYQWINSDYYKYVPSTPQMEKLKPIRIDEDKIFEEWGMTCKQHLEWLKSVKKNAVNKARQEKVKKVLDDVIKDDTIFNSNRAERDTMEFLKKPYKETEGKLYYELSWEFVEAMAQRMQYHKNGKYELYNWKKNPMTPKGIDDMKQAINRHHIEVMKGNHNDGEEILGHIVSYATNSMILWEQLKLNKS